MRFALKTSLEVTLQTACSQVFALSMKKFVKGLPRKTTSVERLLNVEFAKIENK